MEIYSESELHEHEDMHMHSVYDALHKKIESCDKDLKNNEHNIAYGGYEDHDNFRAANDLYKAKEKMLITSILVKGLYRTPYYSHIEIVDESSGITDHYYLSDNEALESPEPIGKDGYLLPFKLDKNLPAFPAVYRCYHAADGKAQQYIDVDGHQAEIVPGLICNDTIENAELLNVVAVYPLVSKRKLDADELLAEKLEENRQNPAFRNIISTLQRQQFEIISQDPDKSFIVQGCAGSGKSQCLLHRLFYLRGKLSQNGWSQVLLLTPTKLFRNYSAEAIKRFQLQNINNCSISDLYCQLLNLYDSRFKNRQYRFEMSEEYLPDGYLREVYSSTTIEKINAEIENAILKYVSDGCSAIGIHIPEQITSEFIAKLSKSLDEEIHLFDSREKHLLKDPEYISQRERYDILQKEIKKAQNNLDRLTGDLEKNKHTLKNLQDLNSNLEDSKNERQLWKAHREAKIQDRKSDLRNAALQLDREPSLKYVSAYADAAYSYLDVTQGKSKHLDDDYLIFLDDYCNEISQELSVATKGQKFETALRKLEKRNAELENRCLSLSAEIDNMNSEYEQHSLWLRNKASEYEGEKSRITLKRSELEKAKYYVGRIESAVFEQEVWNALAPIKENFGIKTVYSIEADGHKKESRILYKSDLLFYLEIYFRLHPETKLPDYKLLCIDEGQDLHKVDYDMLHKLFPSAIMNVFGDTEQVLHQACGIHEWEDETGIENIFSLTTNYRNTPAVVEFCSKRFGIAMRSVGAINNDQRPYIFNTTEELKHILSVKDIVFIVSGKNKYNELCMLLGLGTDEVEYLDTNAEQPNAGMISCYSIFAAKGLEFKKVLVYADGMSKNQLVVACTRAMETLYYYE